MSDSHYDVVIVGHGLAGATLAWLLRWRRQRVLVINANDTPGASHVAAGLITPLSGPKLIPAWGWETAWAHAEQFYRDVERQTQTELLTRIPAVRLGVSSELFERVSAREAAARRPIPVRRASPPMGRDRFFHHDRDLEQPDAARLNVAAYLEASRQSLTAISAFRNETIDESQDLRIDSEQIALPRLQLSTSRLIFCQGFRLDHHWFGAVRFNPAKGQMLTIQAGGISEHRVIHNGLWLVPDRDHQFHVGATFEWDSLDSNPTQAGRTELLRRLKEVVRFPFTVISQRAGVRPTMHDFRPVIGFHPEVPRLGILNGLGTKGSLWAPWMASLLTAALLDQKPIPAEVDVQRWFQ